MTFVKDLLFFGSYFLLMSTTLQSQDAFVFFYRSEYEQEISETQSRGAQLFLYLVFALLCYLTLVVTPFLNLSLRKITIGACALILAKYLCELSTFIHTVKTIMQLASMMLDVVGQSLFYLSSMKVVQFICQKHSSQQTGRMFAIFGAMYGLSIVLGYSISYGCYTKIPTWTYLIVLTCMTIISSVLCFFTFPIQSDTTNNTIHQQLQEQNQEPNPAIPQRPNNRQQAVDQIYRDGMSLGQVFKNTFIWYKKMLLVLGSQMTLGIFIGFSSQLLEYLIWTTQNDQLHTKLIQNLDVIIIFGGGAIFSSIVTGLLCDWVHIRIVGYLSMISAITVFSLSYIAIYSQTLPKTLFLFLLNGVTIFMMGVWILSVCSKIFGGKFEAFSVTIQFIGMAVSIYRLGVVLFQGRVDTRLRLCLQLGLLIGSSIICILFLRKLPSGQLQVTFEESTFQSQSSPQPERQSPKVEINQQKVIQMTAQEQFREKLQNNLEKKEDFPPIDPDYLL